MASSGQTALWAVLQDGSLAVMPKFVDGVEIAHPVLSGGAAQGYFGLEINNNSGHFLPSEESLQTGIDAFAEAGIEFLP
jgi:hypothetical protein